MVFDIIGASEKGPNEKYGDRYPIDYPFDINKVYMTSKIHITYPLRIKDQKFSPCYHRINIMFF